MGELERVVDSIRRHWGKAKDLEELIVLVYNDTHVNPREIPKVIAVIQAQLEKEKA
ncbi:MAG: hypothetical protein KGH87_07175 [Thaumarchaeota archaeon]|nr:hypothetical protein [Nitrososphaerota archaeon]